MADELTEPIIGRSAFRAAPERSTITVSMPAVDDSGFVVRSVDFEVTIDERLENGSFRWPPMVRNELADTVRRLARLVGKMAIMAQ